MSENKYPETSEYFEYEYGSTEWDNAACWFQMNLMMRRYQQLKAVSNSTIFPEELFYRVSLVFECEDSVKFLKKKLRNEGTLDDELNENLAAFEGQISTSRQYIGDFVLDSLRSGKRMDRVFLNLQRQFYKGASPQTCKLGLPLAPVGFEKTGKTPAKIIMSVRAAAAKLFGSDPPHDWMIPYKELEIGMEGHYSDKQELCDALLHLGFSKMPGFPRS